MSSVLSRIRGLSPGSWPLKRQVRAIGLLSLGVLAAAIAFPVTLLVDSENARVADATAELTHLGERLVARYRDLGESFDTEGRPIDPLGSGNEELLRSLTDSILADAARVEGGFFDARRARLVGYAYPTYRGTGRKSDVPAAERATIEKTAAEAVSRGAVTTRVDVDSDVLLFHARSITRAGEPLGAAWVLRRLVGLLDPARRATVVGLTVALGLAALLMALSWGLSRRLNRGVALLEAAGRAKEQELDFPVPHLGVPELDRVGVALERLARTVEAQRADRQALEKKLRHADRLASLGRLVAGMAHELRGPLTGIKLQLDLASRHAQDPARLVGALDTAAQEVDRLNRLVERLLPLSRPSDSARQPTDLHDLLSARLALWSPRAAEAGVKLELGGEGLRGTPVLLDRDRLAQILDNLLANALDALSPRGGCVRVEVSRPSETELWLAVTDDGPGVSPEAGPHLFTPFFTTRDRGTGLGLFLSAELARSMGGELVHSAAPAGGARFELRLPC